MGNRFVPTHIADKRAIELHLQLLEIARMPLIDIAFPKDRKTITICDKNEWTRSISMSVGAVLSLNIQQAKDNGGNFQALLTSRTPRRPQVSKAEVDEEVQRFLSGDENQ